MAKSKKSKGKRRGGKRKAKKGYRRLKGHQLGVAESLGLAKTGLDMAPSMYADAKTVIATPSVDNVKGSISHIVRDAKQYGGVALLGIVISNADQLPFIGKLLAKPKHRLDRVAKKLVGMRV